MLATLRQRNFALLWFGGLISFAGDWALIIALPVFVYDLTGSTLATGVMFIAQTLPRLLLGPLAGVLVGLETLLQQSAPDRYRGRIFGAYGAVCALAMLGGQTLASFLGDRLGVVVAMNGVGALFLVSGLLALALLRGLGITQRSIAPTNVAVIADAA